ncbi:hypothetical protein [Lentzea sp. NEAU-D7]|uniref:hypothetical protein n=1 Tax=Lentzea sp. NEAU-D7 TaxID=2994667 RepID=UPI00224A5F48|nr:hypothetical protein [Lentzea sp. NEAU-D7]MCX2951609.1 hypothetical protein [Lentzea sp. NEAU-D7]
MVARGNVRRMMDGVRVGADLVLTPAALVPDARTLPCIESYRRHTAIELWGPVT